MLLEYDRMQFHESTDILQNYYFHHSNPTSFTIKSNALQNLVQVNNLV